MRRKEITLEVRGLQAKLNCSVSNDTNNERGFFQLNPGFFVNRIKALVFYICTEKICV